MASRFHRLKTPAAVFLLIAGLAVAAVYVLRWVRSEARSNFLAELESNPPLWSDGVSVGGLSPAAMGAYLTEADKAGVDLYTAYLQCENRPTLQRNLACLLLVTESCRFMNHIKATCNSKDAKEILVWIFVAQEEGVLSAGYRDELYSVIARSSGDCAVFATAERCQEKGAVDEAVDRYLDLMSRVSPWSFPARSGMESMPAEARGRACVRHLNGLTVRGIHAARYAAQVPEHRPRAMQYLRDALASKSQKLAGAAAGALIDVLGREDLREAWRRYLDDPSWENLRPLILRIREADQGGTESQPDPDCLLPGEAANAGAENEGRGV